MTALGLDAQQGENIRANFISFIDSQTRAALGQSEIARAALADIFNGVLQESANALRAREIALGERKAADEREYASDRLTQDQAQFDASLALQQQQLALQEQQLNSPIAALQSLGISPGQAAMGVTAAGAGGGIQQQAWQTNTARDLLGASRPAYATTLPVRK
jgi:hypothetical protein